MYVYARICTYMYVYVCICIRKRVVRALVKRRRFCETAMRSDFVKKPLSLRAFRRLMM